MKANRCQRLKARSLRARHGSNEVWERNRRVYSSSREINHRQSSRGNVESLRLPENRRRSAKSDKPGPDRVSFGLEYAHKHHRSASSGLARDIRHRCRLTDLAAMKSASMRLRK